MRGCDTSPAVALEAAVLNAPDKTLRDLRLQLPLHQKQAPDRAPRVAIMRRNRLIFGHVELFRYLAHHADFHWKSRLAWPSPKATKP